MNKPPIDIESTLIIITEKFLLESGQKARQIRLDDSLVRHLGIDSLGRAELLRRIEKAFKTTFPDRLLIEAETLNDIAQYLRAPHDEAESATAHMVQAETKPTIVNPFQGATLTEILFLYAQAAPEKPHIYFQNESGQQEIITYGMLAERSLQFAQSLQTLGLKPAETVAIMQPTHPNFFYAFYGTLLAGGIPVPIYPPFRLFMLETYAKTEARILRNAEVRILITFTEAEKLSHLLKAFVPSLKLVVNANDLIQDEPLKPFYRPKETDLAFIQYTSGSTSDPKGVMLTHANLVANIRAYAKAIRATSDDVTVSWLPLYHDMGLIGMWLGSLNFGIPLVLLTPFSFLNHPERWLWAIHYHRGTLSGAPNFAYELCVRKVDPAMLEGLDLSSWRVAANGAEKVYPRTLAQFADKFASFGFNRKALLPVYGLAESTVALCIPPLDRDYRTDHIDRKTFETHQKAVQANHADTITFLSCGFPIEDHQVRIVNERFEPLTERHVGQLQFRGPSSMQGYYRHPEATARVTHDGWIDSGDLAYIADGEIFITGRKKDVIIKAGRNLYPAEIEEIVGQIPGVRQGSVVAFGVNDKERGTEQLIVVAETRTENPVEQKKLEAAIQGNIFDLFDIVPDKIVLVKPHIIPKTSSGKLQRAACKMMYLSHELHGKNLPLSLQLTRLGGQWLLRKVRLSWQQFVKLVYTMYLLIIIGVTLIPVYCVVRISTPTIGRKTCKIWAKLVQKLSLSPLRITDRHYLNTGRPTIYTCNHASYIDPIVLWPYLPDNILLIGKAELLQAPIIRTFIKKLGFLTVNRLDLSKGLEDTKQIEHALREGASILIFPEGTFGYAAGLRPFRLGAFKIATEAQVPLCPVALQGTRTMLRADEYLFQPAFLTITVAKPIEPKGTEWADVVWLRDAVRCEIAKYCGEPSLDFIAPQTVAPHTRLN